MSSVGTREFVLCSFLSDALFFASPSPPQLFLLKVSILIVNLWYNLPVGLERDFFSLSKCFCVCQPAPPHFTTDGSLPSAFLLHTAVNESFRNILKSFISSIRRCVLECIGMRAILSENTWLLLYRTVRWDLTFFSPQKSMSSLGEVAIETSIEPQPCVDPFPASKAFSCPNQAQSSTSIRFFYVWLSQASFSFLHFWVFCINRLIG